MAYRACMLKADSDQIVDSTLVVNPAYLSRARSAGTYAKIVVHPMKKQELEGVDEMLENGIYERARSEIWKI
jgi:DNA polymerase alpha subunit B